MWQCTAPFILPVGILGNVLTICVLQSMERTGPSYVFFKALAVTDLLFLFVGCGFSWIGHQTGRFPKNASFGFCLVYKWGGYSLGAQSAMMLLVLTAHRALITILKHRIQSVCNMKVARITVVVVVVICFGYNAYIPFVLEMRNGKCSWTKSYLKHGIDTMSWINATVFSILPTVFMIIGNGFLIRTLVITKRAAVAPEARHVHKRLSRIALTALVVSAMFVVLTTPLTVMKVIVNNDPGRRSDPVFRFHYEVCKLLMYLNSAVNFYCYIWTGTVIRSHVASCFSTRMITSSVGPGDTESTDSF
nr:hypothetical protein BaRGS_032703 [Batillaria attramentaria]